MAEDWKGLLKKAFEKQPGSVKTDGTTVVFEDTSDRLTPEQLNQFLDELGEAILQIVPEDNREANEKIEAFLKEHEAQHAAALKRHIEGETE